MTPEDVLSFWFGPEHPDHPHGQMRAEWWIKDPEFDASIRERFGAAVDDARQGGLASWTETPRGALALLILLDQFSRNLFRGDPRTWSEDARSQAIALAMIERGDDLVLPPVLRSFAYMPLMHAEDLRLQDRGVALFETLAEGAPAPLKEALTGTVRYAVIHRDIVARFGRFPHRNAVLGRESSPEEVEFLKGPDSSF